MEWWKQPCWFLDSEDFIGCAALDQATWLRLMRYCVGQENDGVVSDSRGWSDRRWRCVVRLTLRNVRRRCPLWCWQGDDLVVAGYPHEGQAECISRRAAATMPSPARRVAAQRNGARGGRPRNGTPAAPAGPAAPAAPAAEEGTVLQLPAEQLLGTWIRWLGNDPARQEANRQELRQLVALHGLHAVQAQAERLAHASGGKVYPDEISAAFIVARGGTEAPSRTPQVLHLPPRRAR